jgi:hypothetical protein
MEGGDTAPCLEGTFKVQKEGHPDPVVIHHPGNEHNKHKGSGHNSDVNITQLTNTCKYFNMALG